MDDLLYLYRAGDSSRVSHVVIYINEDFVIDERYDYRAPNGRFQHGVLVRSRVGWYRRVVVGGWRIVGE